MVTIQYILHCNFQRPFQISNTCKKTGCGQDTLPRKQASIIDGFSSNQTLKSGPLSLIDGGDRYKGAGSTRGCTQSVSSRCQMLQGHATSSRNMARTPEPWIPVHIEGMRTRKEWKWSLLKMGIYSLFQLIEIAFCYYIITAHGEGYVFSPVCLSTILFTRGTGVPGPSPLCIPGPLWTPLNLFTIKHGLFESGWLTFNWNAFFLYLYEGM